MFTPSIVILLFTTTLLLTGSLPLKAIVLVLLVDILRPHLAANVSSLYTQICSACSESGILTWSSANKLS